MVSEVKGLTDEQLAALESGGLTDEQLAALEKGAPTEYREPPAQDKRPQQQTLTWYEAMLAKAPSWMTAGNRQMRGIAQGAADPSVALAQMVTQKGSVVDRGIAAQEAQYQQGRPEGVDWWRMAGNVAAPTNVMAGAWMPRATTLAGRVKQGAALGTMGGVLTPTQSEDFWQDKAIQAGTGTIAGGLIPVAAHSFSGAVSPRLTAGAEKLRAEGVPLTPGQMLGGVAKSIEDRATSLPLVGDAIQSARREGIEGLNKAVLNRALAPIGEKLKTSKAGADAVMEVHDKVSKAYNAAISKMSLSANTAPKNALPAYPGQQPQSYVNDLFNLRQNFMRSMPPEYLQWYDNVMRDVAEFGTPQGNYSGEALNDAVKLLKNSADGLRNANNPWWGKVKDALDESRRLMMHHMEQQNPANAAEYAAARKAWGLYATARDAAAGAKEQVFSPSQLATQVRQNAVRQRGRAAGKAQLSEGRAQMQDLSDAASATLPSAYPDSGTAGRLMLNAGALGGAGAVAPGVLPPLALSALPYVPGLRRAGEALVAGGQKWRRPIRGGLEAATPILAGGVAASSARAQPLEEDKP